MCRAAVLVMACLAGAPAHALPNKDAQLAAACASCHALRGDEAAMPALGGRSAASIVEALRAYRSGARAGQIMQVVSASLSLEEIDRVADALAGPPPLPPGR